MTETAIEAIISAEQDARPDAPFWDQLWNQAREAAHIVGTTLLGTWTRRAEGSTTVNGKSFDLQERRLVVYRFDTEPYDLSATPSQKG